jgi:hypothetical protein
MHGPSSGQRRDQGPMIRTAPAHIKLADTAARVLGLEPLHFAAARLRPRRERRQGKARRL